MTDQHPQPAQIPFPQNPFPPGASFGAPAQHGYAPHPYGTPPEGYQAAPAPAQPVQEQVFAQPEPSRVPEAARARLTDRLKKRRVMHALAQFEDGEAVLVKGLESGQMDEIRAASRDEDDPDAEVDTTQLNNKMLRIMCYDPETDEKVFEHWTDEELATFPLADLAVIMTSISIVNGNTPAPGKESPSTAAAASSSPSLAS